METMNENVINRIAFELIAKIVNEQMGYIYSDLLSKYTLAELYGVIHMAEAIKERLKES